MSFFNKLEYQCSLKGLTVSAFLQSNGFSKGNITKWKSGNEPLPATKIKIARLLELPDNYFIVEKVEQQKAPPTEAESAKRKKLIDVIEQLPEEKYDQAILILQAAFQDDLNK